MCVISAPKTFCWHLFCASRRESWMRVVKWARKRHLTPEVLTTPPYSKNMKRKHIDYLIISGLGLQSKINFSILHVSDIATIKSEWAGSCFYCESADRKTRSLLSCARPVSGGALDQKPAWLPAARSCAERSLLSVSTDAPLSGYRSLCLFFLFLWIIFIWWFSTLTRCIEMGKLHSKHGKISYSCEKSTAVVVLVALRYFRVTHALSPFCLSPKRLFVNQGRVQKVSTPTLLILLLCDSRRYVSVSL